jgi:(p)ppGpp synthase/HD superfamily hydrolase
MIDWQQLTSFVKWVHSDQHRKYTGAAYATHPLRCAAAVMFFTGNLEAAAGMALHDGWEDQPERCEPNLVRALFGPRPYELMFNLTSASKRDHIKGSRAERKAYDREAFANLQMQDDPYLVKLCKLVDRNDNLMDIDVAQDGPFAKQYAAETRLLLPYLVVDYPDIRLIPGNDLDLVSSCYAASQGLHFEIRRRLESIEQLTKGLP